MVLAIFVSACVALYETIVRLIHPQHLSHLSILAAAGVVGFVGNEVAAQIRLRAGGLTSIPATAANVKLERRREFLGEGMRFWDLVRWGDASILTENIPAFSTNRTWKDTDKLLPIPQSEIEKTDGAYKLVQNPGYN